MPAAPITMQQIVDQYLADRVCAVCLEALTNAYEQARMDGLCAAGAWEVARDQIQHCDLGAILAPLQIPLIDE